MKPSSEHPLRQRIFIRAVTIVGLCAALRLLAHPVEKFSPIFIWYLVLALVSSGLKVSLPGVTGTMSVSFLFILTGLSELGLTSALLLGLGSTLVQIYWHAKKKPGLYQVLFNVAVITIAITVADVAFHSRLAEFFGGSLPIKLLLATLCYFLVNTILVASAIALTE